MIYHRRNGYRGYCCCGNRVGGSGGDGGDGMARMMMVLVLVRRWTDGRRPLQGHDPHLCLFQSWDGAQIIPNRHGGGIGGCGGGGVSCNGVMVVVFRQDKGIRHDILIRRSVGGASGWWRCGCATNITINTITNTTTITNTITTNTRGRSLSPHDKSKGPSG